MAKGYVNIICANCGEENDIEEWTTRHGVSLPFGNFQCPLCNVAFRRTAVEEGNRSRIIIEPIPARL